MVCKPVLQSEQTRMNASAYVERASGMVELIDRHIVAMGLDRDQTEEQLARAHGVPRSTFFALRYRPPKSLGVDTYFALCDALEDLATKAVHAAENNIATARAARRSPDSRLVRAAAHLVVAAHALIGSDEDETN